MYFDSHLHFDGLKGEGEAEGAVARALEAGVTRMMAVGGSETANAYGLSLAGRYPEHIRASVGYDRDHAAHDYDVARLAAVLQQSGGAAAIGETGLDYHYQVDTATAQKTLFSEMLALAREHSLPAIVHSRDADDDMIAILSEHVAEWRGDPGRIAVLHCFTGCAPFAGRLLELGLYISFSGIVSFSNADELRSVAKEVPSERLLIETDSPYLAPVPMRGKSNEPAYVPHVAEAVARVRGCEPDEIASLTWTNANRLFGWV